MSDEKPVEPADRYQPIEARIARLLNRDVGVKASYSELRNFHSVICNDLKAAIVKKLGKILTALQAVNTENLKLRFQKKEAHQLEVEGNLNKQLEALPDVSPQNMQTLFLAVRELLPVLLKLQGQRAAALKAEKKDKKIKGLESELRVIEWLTLQLYHLYDAMMHYGFFETYCLALIRARYNRDDIRELTREIHTVFKEAFKIAKNEELEVNHLRLIGLVTQRLIVRLGIYEACDLQTVYSRILKGLPRQLVQQFNSRYFARRREAGKNVEELKKTAEYQTMTKKFLTLKLKKFYDLMRAYQTMVGRLFALDDKLGQDFATLLKVILDKTYVQERIRAIDTLQASLNEKLPWFYRYTHSLPQNEDLSKNSLETLFSFSMHYYTNVLKDTYTPLSSQEMAAVYLKQQKPAKESMLSPDELKLLAGESFKREEAVLKVFFDGILSLSRGETDEKPIMEALMTAIGAEYDRGRKDEMRTKTLNRLLAAISPEEIQLLVGTLESLPPDRERVGTPLGRLYVELAEKYPPYLKRAVSHAEKIDPTDSGLEKLRKSATGKYQQLLAKATEPQAGVPTPVEILKQKQTEEQTAVKAVKESNLTLANYLITQLIAHWKMESAKTVTSHCLVNRERIAPAVKFRELDRYEMKLVKSHFSGEQLGELEKHYKTLTEAIGPSYLKHPKPHFKLEYLLLFLGKQLIQEFRNPAKSYPRLFERMTALSR